MSWMKKHWRPILAVGSALTGAVLGAAVQEVLNTNLRLMAAITAVLSIAVIGLLATLLATTDARKAAEAEILENIRSLVDEYRRDSARIDGRVSESVARLGGEMDKLAKQFGLRVERQLITELNTVRSLDEDVTARLVSAAEEEICVLDLLSDDGRWSDEVMEQGYSRRYFELLTEKVRNAPPGLAYRRTVQVADPAQALAQARSAGFVKHCRDMLELRSLKRHKVSLRVAQRRFPFKFIIIDRTHLVLQLQEYHESQTRLQIWGEIVITDSAGALISIFQEIWAELNDDPRTRAVTLADLRRAGR